MADPFEVRIKFTHQLQHLNASVNSAQKAALYAIKHQDMDEDLHSCILEQMERNNMNNRANIMFFLEQLSEASLRENAPQFVDFIRRDILRIVNAVAPADGSGAANVKVTRRVLVGLQKKKVISGEVLGQLEETLKERDTNAEDVRLSPTQRDKDDAGASFSPSATRANGFARPDKRQIEQRIEEDRERHKRLRENIWAVNSEGYAEIDAILDDASDFGEDDYLLAEEEAAERKLCMEEALRNGCV